MAIKPITKLDWVPDDDPAKIIEPGSEKKAAGWLKEEKPPFQYFNWAWNLIDKWLNYAEAGIDENVAAIAAETTARNNADTVLQGNIDSEASARVDGDNAVQAALNAHVANLSNPHQVYQIPSGTVMLFGQASPPAGWTRKTDWADNAMLCYAASGFASGGTANPQDTHRHVGPSHTHTMGNHTHVAPSHAHSTGSVTLGLSHIPAHEHLSPIRVSLTTLNRAWENISGYHDTTINPDADSVSASNNYSDMQKPDTGMTGSGGSHNHGNTGSGGNTATAGPSTNTTGSAGNGNTTYNSAPRYQEVIAATKD